MFQYDYIILGSGAAGLSLLMRMVDSPYFESKKILLIDREPKKRNDKTWCFWEIGEGFFEQLVYKKWNGLAFKNSSFSKRLQIAPYEYKLIRSIDFYEYCFTKLNKHPNVDVMIGDVKSVVTSTHDVVIHFHDRSITCARATVFNSLYNPSDPRARLHLLQHFKGWIVETTVPSFDPEEAVLMDFRVHQQNGTSFIYLLPVSPTKALVEYTVFSRNTLPDSEYDVKLNDYLSRLLQLGDFKILEHEFGIIPMTNARFKFYQNGMYNIGTAGGQTKASTGYTFQFIQKRSDQIVRCLENGTQLDSLPVMPTRFRFYDSVLLQLLSTNSLGGREIFSRLFERNKASLVFKFLDNETTLGEELRLISTLQTVPFLKAALQLIHK